MVNKKYFFQTKQIKVLSASWKNSCRNDLPVMPRSRSCGSSGSICTAPVLSLWKQAKAISSTLKRRRRRQKSLFFPSAAQSGRGGAGVIYAETFTPLRRALIGNKRVATNVPSIYPKRAGDAGDNRAAARRSAKNPARAVYEFRLFCAASSLTWNMNKTK